MISKELYERATDLGLSPQPWWDDKLAKWAITMEEERRRRDG